MKWFLYFYKCAGHNLKSKKQIISKGEKMFKMILKRFGKTEWITMTVVILFIGAQVWLDLKLIDYLSEITGLITVPSADNGIKDVWIAGFKMLSCALVSGILSIICGYFISKISAKVSQRLRSDVFNKVESFSKNELFKFSNASLITRCTNDITQIQNFLSMGLQMLIKSPLLAFYAIYKILGKSWQWSLATGISIFVLFSVIGIILYFALPKFKKYQGLIDNLNKSVLEDLQGVRVIRAYNADDFQNKKFEKTNKDIYNTNIVIARSMAIIFPTLYFIMNMMTLAIYWIGAYLIDGATAIMARGTLFTDMIVFVSYAMYVITAFLMLAIIFIIIPRAIVSSKRIDEVLKSTTTVIEGNETMGQNCKGLIEFKNVSFKYPQAQDYILKNINLKINQGETVAFIGSTGSGKSSLINLIARFYDVTEGEVFVDDRNIKEYKFEALYDKIGYVSQNAFLFKGTIESNLKLGHQDENVEKERIDRALKLACADEFVNALPLKEKAEISQAGANFSGGQKQRISIARAFIKEPEIYIFDDCFSALDYKTDRQVRSNLKESCKESTVIIVAQRIGTIMQADKIVVLDKGEIVGLGTHDELLNSCEVYKEIALSQLSEEELKHEEQ